MRRWGILILFLLVLNSCGGWEELLREPNVYPTLSPPYRISFATDIDAEQGDFTSLSLAIEMWNDAHDGLLVFAHDPTSNFLVYVGPYPDLLEDARGGALRFEEGQICAIYVKSENVGDTALMAHEIGHCLGFDHTQNASSIMYKEPRDYSEITPTIIEELDELTAADEAQQNLN